MRGDSEGLGRRAVLQRLAGKAAATRNRIERARQLRGHYVPLRRLPAARLKGAFLKVEIVSAYISKDNVRITPFPSGSIRSCHFFPVSIARCVTASAGAEPLSGRAPRAQVQRFR